MGNSIVSKLNQPAKKNNSIDLDTGKSSPNLFGEFDVMAAAAAQKQKAVDLNTQVAPSFTSEELASASQWDLGGGNFGYEASEYAYAWSGSSDTKYNGDFNLGNGQYGYSPSAYADAWSGWSSDAVKFRDDVESLALKRNSYDDIRDGFGTFRDKTIADLDRVALADKGGIITGIASVIRAPAVLGLGAIDAGLSLGELFFDTADHLINDVDTISDVFNGVDVRGSMSLKNQNKGLEFKYYAGTDFASAFSVKGLDFESRGLDFNLDLKKNATVHYRLSDLSGFFDADAWRTDYIFEVDKGNKIDLYSSNRLVKPKAYELSVTPGLRHNIATSTTRGSANFKLELPEVYQRYTFGWTPSVGIEVRK